MARGRPTGWDVLRRKRLASDDHQKTREKAARYRAKPGYRERHAADMRAEREARQKAGI